jgi:hypothetical protein
VSIIDERQDVLSQIPRVTQPNNLVARIDSCCRFLIKEDLIEASC